MKFLNGFKKQTSQIALEEKYFKVKQVLFNCVGKQIIFAK